jgi:hypothetical protein
MAKQKSSRHYPKDHTERGGTGGPPGKKKRSKVRRAKRKLNNA